MSSRGEVMDDVRRLDPIDDDRLIAAWSQSRAKSAVFQAVLEEAATTAHEPEAASVAQPVRRRGLRLAAAVATVVALVVGLLVANPLGDDPPAIAGWTPQPQPPDASALQLVDRQCRTMVTDFEASDAATVERVLEDQRGSGMVLVYDGITIRGADGLALCTAVEHPEHGWSSAMSLVELQADRTPDPVAMIGAMSKVSQSWEARLGITAVIGQTTPNVAKVVTESGEREVQATIDDGLFLTWWPATPGSTEPFNVQAAAYDSRGQIMGTDQWPPQPQP